MNKIDAVVTAATGQIGSKTVAMLLREGRSVRAVSRNPGKLEALGAESHAASLDDADAMARAFEGASSVFLLIPPNYASDDMRGFQRKVANAYAQAIRRSGVQRVVLLSSLGADKTEGTGPILGLREAEDILDGLPNVAVLSLRPTFFMENWFWQIPVIKGMGAAGTPMRADLPMAMVATRDIAEAAARALLDGGLTGRSKRELLGERDLTNAEAARAIGEAIGKPDLGYVQFSYADAANAMRGSGMSANVVELMIEMYKGFNEGVIVPREKRSPANTTRTSIETFAKETFAPAFNAS